MPFRLDILLIFQALHLDAPANALHASHLLIWFYLSSPASFWWCNSTSSLYAWTYYFRNAPHCWHFIGDVRCVRVFLNSFNISAFELMTLMLAFELRESWQAKLLFYSRTKSNDLALHQPSNGVKTLSTGYKVVKNMPRWNDILI